MKTKYLLLILYYTCCAFLVVHIGNDNGILNLLELKSYYTDLLLALGLSYVWGIYIHLLYTKSSFFAESISLYKRIVVGFSLGILLPLTISMMTEVVYIVYFLKFSLQQSPILYLELPLTFIFLLIPNLLYSINIEFSSRHKQVKTNLEQDFSIQLEEKLKESLDLAKTAQTAKPEYIVVNRGSAFLKIALENIAHIELYDKVNYLTTLEGERFVHPENMKYFSDLLPTDNFYQLNRQLITHRNSIKAYHSTSTRKLKIDLSPTPLADEHFIAKANVSKFLMWYKP